MFKFFETVFLCRPRWPQTYHSPASVFAVLGLQVCAATLGLHAFQVADLCFQLPSRNTSPCRPRCSALCRFIAELYTVVLTADLILFCVHQQSCHTSFEPRREPQPLPSLIPSGPSVPLTCLCLNQAFYIFALFSCNFLFPHQPVLPPAIFRAFANCSCRVLFCLK